MFTRHQVSSTRICEWFFTTDAIVAVSVQAYLFEIIVSSSLNFLNPSSFSFATSRDVPSLTVLGLKFNYPPNGKETFIHLKKCSPRILLKTEFNLVESFCFSLYRATQWIVFVSDKISSERLFGMIVILFHRSLRIGFDNT